MKKGLIFDMDGTLWDSSENVAASWTEKIRELGIDMPDITQKDVMGVMGLTMDRIADIIFKGFCEGSAICELFFKQCYFCGIEAGVEDLIPVDCFAFGSQ